MPGVTAQVPETLARINTLERDIAAKLVQVSVLQDELAAIRARVELEQAQPAAACLADVVERASTAKACEFPAPQVGVEGDGMQEAVPSVEWGAVVRLAVTLCSRTCSALPAPVVTLGVNGEQGIYIAPDSADLLALLGPIDYTSYFDALGFDF